MRKRLFVDMDGTLAEFKNVDTLEVLYEQGYFKNLKPQINVVDAIKEIINKNEVEVFILSAVLSDSKYALDEKNEWINKFLPEIDKDHRIFPPCGEDKKNYIPDHIRNNDFLLDDYTHNIMLWSPPTEGIKLLNGINHTRGTWKGSMLSFNKSSAELAKDISNIIFNDIKIRDNFKNGIKKEVEMSSSLISEKNNQMEARYYKYFYAGSGGQDNEATEYQNSTGWNKIWASDTQGMNGDTWIVYRNVSDLPKFLQDYAIEQENCKKRNNAMSQDNRADRTSPFTAQKAEPQITFLYKDEKNGLKAGINADGELYFGNDTSGYNLRDTVENRRYIERDIARYTGQKIDLVNEECSNEKLLLDNNISSFDEDQSSRKSLKDIQNKIDEHKKSCVDITTIEHDKIYKTAQR